MTEFGYTPVCTTEYLNNSCTEEETRLRARNVELEAEVDRLKQLLEEFAEDEVPNGAGGP